jgi:putative acetyltransferase
VSVRIRNEGHEDVIAIEAVTAAAFLEAPHTSHAEQFIVAALRAAGALSVSLVAEAEGAIVGHVAVSPVTISDGAPGWFGLGPISVLPAWQGRGVGSALMRAALEALREMGAAGCVVVGEPAFYGRFGFRAEAGLVLPEVPAEYFQAVEFGPNLPQGIVSYHDAFNAQGVRTSVARGLSGVSLP